MEENGFEVKITKKETAEEMDFMEEIIYISSAVDFDYDMYLDGKDELEWMLVI